MALCLRFPSIPLLFEHHKSVASSARISSTLARKYARARWYRWTGSGCEYLHRRLKRARAEQELDDVAFVRLQPVEPDGGDRRRCSAGRCVCASISWRWNCASFGDGAAHQRGADLLQHLLLRALDDAGEREHVFRVGTARCRASRSESPSAADSRSAPSRPAAGRRRRCVLDARFVEADLDASSRSPWPRRER